MEVNVGADKQKPHICSIVRIRYYILN